VTYLTCCLTSCMKFKLCLFIRLVDCQQFYVPLKNFSLIWRCHHYQWRASKFRPMLETQSLWVGRDLYRATPSVTRVLGFSGLIRRIAPFSHLLWHTRGCRGSILSYLDPHGVLFINLLQSIMSPLLIFTILHSTVILFI
jgi:hypothetical protein